MDEYISYYDDDYDLGDYYDQLFEESVDEEYWDDGYDEWIAWQLDHPVRAWLLHQWDKVCWRVQGIKRGFLEVCPECKQPERVLWHEVGDHSDCLPF